ncbi:MAG: gamma-glutamyltransferase [Deltaproteobacteria bacterium]|nr:MAG: gamma-glutamyltransferase [Deltaproteobacteria bacterium]
MLAAGGNAFDAAVAAGFASAVAEPALTSLGGGGFLLARTNDGRSVLFDFFVDTPGLGAHTDSLEPHFLPVTVKFPGSEQVFNVGRGSVALPGTLAGLVHVHERMGALRLSQVVAPAIRLAREGVRLTEQQAYFLDLLRPIMTLEESGRALFEPSGRYLGAGDLYRNPDLAAFLTALPEHGPEALYAGEVAERIVADMQSGGGLLTEDDLRSYRVIERDPLAADYRGYTVLTNPPPSFGGGLLLLALELLGSFDAAAQGPNSPEHATRMVAVMQETDRLREAGVAGPAGLGTAERAAACERIRTATGGTTHVSVCDGDGNVASMTTSNGEGSGYFAPGTGIMLNNMMGEDDLHPEGFHAAPAGKRVSSMMSPTVVTEDQRTVLVAGSGGSKRIRTALLQVLSAVLDFSMPLEEAVEAPRLHWDGACVQAEPGFSKRALAALERRWPVNRWKVRDVYFGGVHVASPTGEAAGDPRRGGHVRRI